MRQLKEEPSCSTDQAINLISAVKELHRLSSQELNKLLRDSENFILHYHTENGSYMQINVEKLAHFLPLHLVAVLMSSDRDEALFRYLLCGFRLLYSLCSLAPRQPKLEQILLDDVKVSEQLLDLVLYSLIILGGYRQENHVSSRTPLLHSALVSCSLHLLTECISTQWQDLVHVLLAHHKVDIFMDVAFGAVCMDVRFLQLKLSTQHTDFSTTSFHTSEQIVIHLCQQCEASLHFLQSLCQQKLFRERLVKNKELCAKGGILLLARSTLKLDVMPLFKESSAVVSSVSRLKSKVLSILLHLCEAESISYLDEVASSPGSLDLAKSVALEVLELLKTALGRDTKYISSCSDKTYPMGLLQLNAMRLADIFSDDSNFRSYVTKYFTEFLTAIFLLPHGEFLSSWCSSDLPIREEDGTLEFDPFAASGWVLDSFSSLGLLNIANLESTFTPNNVPQASYAHQRTSLLVKVIANLHCFVPDICEEQERNLFLHKFLECLQLELPKSSPGFSFTNDAQKATAVCRNLRSLLGHAESLIPNFLNEEDVQLFRVFFKQIQSLIPPAESEGNRVQESKFEGSTSWEKSSKLSMHHQEVQSTGGCSSPLLRKVGPYLNNRAGNLKEEMSENSAFQEVDQLYAKSEHLDQTEEAIRQDGSEDKGKSERVASTCLTEIDRDVQNVETSGSDSSSTRGKNSIAPMDKSEFPKSSDQIKEGGYSGVQEDEKVEAVLSEEKQRRKRKRTIMNDKQMALIERALLDEPEMQKNAASIQSWADKLSVHGSEVTSSQLKNWLNNRKARLARAAKDARASQEGDNANPDKQGGSGGPFCESPESPGEEFYVQSTTRGGTHQSITEGSRLRAGIGENPETGLAELVDTAPAESVQHQRGQYALPADAQGEEIGKEKNASATMR
ncbi:nodulin homeobox [Malania oleifera]|uniref:nodulin homeobox n=1 Tax=Malania oleifera TaxID=397392 RepID=UPI0025AE27C1|nr:nodulin homeobox [Malania oleifera]XP_057964014.1 nodulin homeobox [Malania oleifera]